MVEYLLIRASSAFFLTVFCVYGRRQLLSWGEQSSMGEGAPMATAYV